MYIFVAAATALVPVPAHIPSQGKRLAYHHRDDADFGVSKLQIAPATLDAGRMAETR